MDTCNWQTIGGTADDQSAVGHVHATEAVGATATYSTQAPNALMNSNSISDTTTTFSATVTVDNTGGNGAHNNMQPFLGINYIIALVGVFPSRN